MAFLLVSHGPIAPLGRTKLYIPFFFVYSEMFRLHGLVCFMCCRFLRVCIQVYNVVCMLLVCVVNGLSYNP